MVHGTLVCMRCNMLDVVSLPDCVLLVESLVEIYL